MSCALTLRRCCKYYHPCIQILPRQREEVNKPTHAHDKHHLLLILNCKVSPTFFGFVNVRCVAAKERDYIKDLC